MNFRQFRVRLVLMLWPIMPTRARAWAFMNDDIETADSDAGRDDVVELLDEDEPIGTCDECGDLTYTGSLRPWACSSQCYSESLGTDY